MKIVSDKNYFEPRARLLLQLGDKLIKNENIALLELIKNSYDADAKEVTVKLSNIKDKGKGKIDIIDNGTGMDIDIIKDVWLQPGSDYKEEVFKKRVQETARTGKYRRLPIGEKGIGRFGAHKLGDKIELVSRMSGKLEVVVRIDWKEFAKNKLLKDAKFEVFEREPEYFLRNRTGTRITITDLRTPWDRRMVRSLYKSVFTLNSPFRKKKGKFKAEIEVDTPSLLEGLIEWDEVKKFALYHFKCTFAGSEIKTFLYEFTPWDRMSKLDYRKIEYDEQDNEKNNDFVKNRSAIVKKNLENKKEEIIINLHKNYGTEYLPKTLGQIAIEGYIFDWDPKVMELGDTARLKLLKEYLNEQGGIRVYRDNMRINEYGEKGNDWLNLESKRINAPGRKISRNLILSIIDLKSEESSALIEKTNREGFIEDQAFQDFRDAISYIIGLVEVQRDIDKDELRKKYNPKEKEEPVLSNLFQLRTIVNSKVKEPVLREKITVQIDKIEKDYNELQEVLLTSAGAGLAMGVSIHELEKVIKELNRAVNKEQTSDRIHELVKHLDKLIQNYNELLKQNESEQENIKQIVQGALFNVEYRLDSHEVTTINDCKKYQGDTLIKCSKRFMMGTVMNIIDNSIFWLKKKETQLKKIDEKFIKKIYFNLYDDREGYLDLLIADNGIGFDLPISQITKPFISSKTGGIGLGLHVVKEVMKFQEGSLYFPEYGEYEVPDEFKKGAIIILKLKK